MKKYIIYIIIAIFIIIGIGSGIGIHSYLKTKKPTNRKVESYLSQKLTEQGQEPKNLKIDSISSKNKYAFDVNFSFSTAEKNYEKNYNDQITYDFSDKWIPSEISVISSNEIPTKAIDLKDAKNQFEQEVTSLLGISVQTNNLKFEPNTINLTGGIQTFKFENSYKNKSYSIEFTGNAIFKFLNNNWQIENCSDVQKKITVTSISKSEILNAFNEYQSENNNSSGGLNSSDGNKEEVTKDNINLQNMTGTATISEATSNNNGTANIRDYTVDLNFDTSGDISQYGWKVTKVIAPTTWNTVVVSPPAKILEYIATQGEINGNSQTTFTYGEVQATNIKFDSSNDTATATLTGTYDNWGGNNVPKQGTFTGNFIFKNDGWQVVSIN